MFANDLAALAAQSDVGPYLTTGRLAGTSAALLALAGAVLGVLARAMAVRRTGHHGRRGAIVAVLAGLAGIVLGVVVLAVADGGLGTGNGVAGGYIALVLGPVALVFAWLALSRSRRAA